MRRLWHRDFLQAYRAGYAPADIGCITKDLLAAFRANRNEFTHITTLGRSDCFHRDKDDMEGQGEFDLLPTQFMMM